MTQRTLTRVMTRHSLTIADTARLLHLSPAAVGHWLAGRREPIGPAALLLVMLDHGTVTPAQLAEANRVLATTQVTTTPTTTEE